MADKSPSAVVPVLTRDEYRDLYRRDYALFAPEADTGPGGQPYVDASLVADSTMVLFADAVTLGDATNLSDATGEYLLRWGNAEGVGPKLPPAGGSGHVVVKTSNGGATLFAGDLLKDDKGTGLRFAVSSTGLYLDGQAVPIAGVDTGAETNLDAGTVLTFVSPRPGCAPTAVVAETAGGDGLTGGRGEESDDDYRARIVARNADPPAAGNDAEIRQIVESLSGISVAKAFAYPAIFGPGTTGVTFVLRPDASGATRAPNAAQLLVARAVLEQRLPKDDGIFVAFVLETPLTLVLRVAWASGSAWANNPAWPPNEGADVRVAALPAPTALSCRAASPAPIASPVAGQSVALYDPGARAFVRKRIASAVEQAPSTVWDLTFDGTNAASDTVYVPAAGQCVSPWSDLLAVVLAELLAYADGLGPGEMVSTFPDEGYRRRRVPEITGPFPSTITNKLLAPVLALGAVSDAVLADPVTPHDTPVGVAGTSVNLFRLADVGIYPF